MTAGDKLIQVLDEYKRLEIAEQIDYDKFYLYSLITHSTAIEGSTVTEIENQLLFDEGISAKGRTIQEQLMNLDLKKAYEESIRLAKAKTDFSIDMLKGLSAIVMKNTGSTYNTLQGSFDASKGDLRLVNVTAGAGGRSYMNFLKVPSRLADFCSKMNERRLSLQNTDDIIEQYLLSFDAHYELVTIHPWVDGNGRMSRLIMNHIQFEYGLVPTKVNKDDKAEYIQALVDSREQDTTEPFREFMLQEHIKNLQQEIVAYKDSVNEVDSKGGQKTEKVDRKTRLSKSHANSFADGRTGAIYPKGGQKNSIEREQRKHAFILPSGRVLSKTRDAILDMIAQDAKVTSTQMAYNLGINRSAVSKHLKKMQENGIIKREGPDKGGKWVILSNRNLNNQELEN